MNGLRKRKKMILAKLFTFTQAVHTSSHFIYVRKTRVKITRQWKSTLTLKNAKNKNSKKKIQFGKKNKTKKQKQRWQNSKVLSKGFI